jgi:hypothetical protein
MLTSSLMDGTDVVAASWEGRLTAADVRRLRHELDFVASTYGRVRILVEVAPTASVGPAALWEDVRSVGSVDDLDRIALLTDERWAEAVADVAGGLLPAEVKVFDTDRRAEALAWASS